MSNLLHRFSAIVLTTSLLFGCRKEDEFPRRQVGHMFVNATTSSVIIEATSDLGNKFQATLAPGDSLLDGPTTITYYRRAFQSRIEGNSVVSINLRKRQSADSCFVSSSSTNANLLLPQGYTSIPRYRPDIEFLYRYRITEADFESLEVCP